MHRNDWLALKDQDLLEMCTLGTYIGSGAGGQHRNKTQSGVILKFTPLNLEIRNCEDRSQHVNKLKALFLLRLKIVLNKRESPSSEVPFPFPGSNGHIQSKNAQYLPWLGDVLDRIVANDGDTKPAALAWGLSHTALIRLLGADKEVWKWVQDCRAKFGKSALNHVK